MQFLAWAGLTVALLVLFAAIDRVIDIIKKVANR